MSHDDLVQYIGSMERQVADTEVRTLVYVSVLNYIDCDNYCFILDPLS